MSKQQGRGRPTTSEPSIRGQKVLMRLAEGVTLEEAGREFDMSRQAVHYLKVKYARWFSRITKGRNGKSRRK